MISSKRQGAGGADTMSLSISLLLYFLNMPPLLVLQLRLLGLLLLVLLLVVLLVSFQVSVLLPGLVLVLPLMILLRVMLLF